MNKNKTHFAKQIAIVLCLAIPACSNPQPGPDKTAAGAVLGAGWGAGAGAVVGHQLGYAGEGTAIGAGFGLVDGALTGAGADLLESGTIDQQERLTALKIQNLANAREIARMQHSLDTSARRGTPVGVYQVFFDPDETSVRAGSIANLEVIADALRQSPEASLIQVVGHTDDTASPEHNERLAEARARAVAAYMAARGISMDQIIINSHGAKRPIASNTTEVGRQLNRRVDIYIAR